MRRIWRYLTSWPSGWIAVPLAAALAFLGGLFGGFVLLQQETNVVVPMATALALGAGVGEAWRQLKPKRQKPSAWPSPPPPGRPD